MSRQSKRDAVAAISIFLMFVGCWILPISPAGIVVIAVGVVVMLLLILVVIRER